MNTTTFSKFSDDMRGDRTPMRKRMRGPGEPHILVQLLSVIAFGVFSIVGIVLAFSAFWLVGLVLAVTIAWTWAGSRAFGGRRNWPDQVSPDQTGIDDVRDLAPVVSTRRSSGNASFDAYRGEILQRLEQENRDFEDFLIRLRAASDAKEFDQFIDDRALSARDAKVIHDFEPAKDRVV